MKILHVITSLRTGGAEHLMVDLLPELRSLGNEVELLVFDGTRTPFMAELEVQGVRILSLAVGRNVYHPLNVVGLCKFMRKYDVIHTHNTACQLFVPMARCLTMGGAKLVTTEHNTTNRRRGKWYFKDIDKWMYSCYDHVICISSSAQGNLEKHIGRRSSLVTINNGIRVKRFIRPVQAIADDKKDFVITMVAGFRLQKDQDTLIRAVAQLPGNYSVRLVGDGPRREELRQLALSLHVADRVNFMGIRSDIPELLTQSDIVVLSSHWEGFGLAAIEGMASGRPVIVSDVAGLANIVHGSGVVFLPGDASQLAAEIRGLCENPERYRQVAEKCQEKAKQYDISVMAAKYNELYQSL